MLPNCSRNVIKVQPKCSLDVPKLQPKCALNVAEMYSKCSQKGAQMQPKSSQIAAEMCSKCSQTAAKLQQKCSQNLKITQFCFFQVRNYSIPLEGVFAGSVVTTIYFIMGTFTWSYYISQYIWLQIYKSMIIPSHATYPLQIHIARY